MKKHERKYTFSECVCSVYYKQTNSSRTRPNWKIKTHTISTLDAIKRINIMFEERMLVSQSATARQRMSEWMCAWSFFTVWFYFSTQKKKKIQFRSKSGNLILFHFFFFSFIRKLCFTARALTLFTRYVCSSILCLLVLWIFVLFSLCFCFLLVSLQLKRFFTVLFHVFFSVEKFVALLLRQQLLLTAFDREASVW